MDSPLISIITITLNAQQYLDECLRSVCFQKRAPDFEHIVWDGGSRDQTLTICDRYPHIRLISGKDSGISDAMNQAVLLARGKYVLFLHADDRLSGDFVLAWLHSLIQSHGKQDWYCGIGEVIDSFGEVISKGRFDPFVTSKLWKYNVLSHPSVLMKKDFLTSLGGFDIRLRFCMDYDLWLRAIKVTAPYLLSFSIGQFRSHEGSTSTSSVSLLAVAREAYEVRNRYVKNYYQRHRSYKTYQRRIRSLSGV